MEFTKEDISIKYPKISHLTNEQLGELIQRYYAGEKITILLKDYYIKASSGSLVSLFPPVVHEDQQCPFCNVAMVSKRQPRTNSWTEPKVYCPLCSHEATNKCGCNKCQEMRENQRQADEERKRALIRNCFSDNSDLPHTISSLSLRERVLLGALLRNGLEEEYTAIKPLDQQIGKLSPNESYDINILRSLYHNKLILVHPESSLTAFVEQDDVQYPTKFYLDRTMFQINLCIEGDLPQILNQIIHPKESDFNSYPIEDYYDLWKEIAFQECIEYLSYSRKNVGFDSTIGEVTVSVFNDLLDNYSTSQIYCLIHKSVAEASKLYLEKKMPKNHAANVVVNSCRKKGERYLSNNWPIKSFQRDFNCPQSTLSHFYYNRILKIGDIGFEVSPKSIFTDANIASNLLGSPISK